MRILKGGSQTMYVWRNIQLVRGRVILFLCLLISTLLLFALNVFPYATLGLLIAPVAYVLGAYSYSSYLTWLSGSAGEKAEHFRIGVRPTHSAPSVGEMLLG